MTALAIVTIVGCGGGSGSSAAVSTTTLASVWQSASSVSGGSSGAESSSIAAVPASFDDLAARLVTTVPAGFVMQVDSVGDTGPSDLAKAVRDDEVAGIEPVLRSEGFVRGYQRLWIAPDDTEVIVFLYQFETDRGARQDFTRHETELASQSPAGATSFTIAGLPADGSSAVQGMVDASGVAVVDFITGPFLVRVICNGPSLDGLQARVTAIALDQLSRL